MVNLDLNNCLERKLHERLEKYLSQNRTYESVMQLIAQDFPYLEEKLKEHCDDIIYAHYNLSKDREQNAVVRKLALLHVNDLDSPFNSHLGTDFMLYGGDDILVGICIENPLYLHKEAQGYYSVYVDDIEINRFHCRMKADERSQSLYIPLNLIKNGLVELEGPRKSFKVVVKDENIKDRSYSINLDVGYSKTFPSDYFEVQVAGIHRRESNIFEDTFLLTEIDSLYLRVWLGTPGEYEIPQSIRGTIIVIKEGGEQSQENLILPIYLFRDDMGNGSFKEDKKMFYCRTDVDSYECPTYILEPGKYTVALIVWNDAIWTETITILAERQEEDFQEHAQELETEAAASAATATDGPMNALMDEMESLMNDFDLWSDAKAEVGLTMMDNEGQEIAFADQEGIIYYKKIPDKFRISLQFDKEYFPMKDIEVSVHESILCQSKNKQVIRKGDISSSESRKVTLEFDSFIKKGGTNSSEIYVVIEQEGSRRVQGKSYLAISFSSPEEFLDVQEFSLHNLPFYLNDDEVLGVISESRAQNAFDLENLKVLGAICKLRNVKNVDFQKFTTQMSWIAYDDLGRIVSRRFADFDTSGDDFTAYAYVELFKDVEWKKGEYRIELQWCGHSLLNAGFTVGETDNYNEYDIDIIKKRQVIIKAEDVGSALERLERMAGLKKVKSKIHSLVNFAKLQQKRQEAGLPTKVPSLHARFLGNPGTGKTTVARLLGQIYKQMGLLSSGHVVIEERKNFLGRFYDSEANAVKNALDRAKGGILLIDEAYNLYVENDPKDPGRRVLEYLLTALGDEENRDWMLILAGYPDEMEQMLNSNPGIKSRVNEVVEFEDLEVEDLLKIAELYCENNSYELSEDARKALREVITLEFDNKDKHFGNGRYVNKLMETVISTNMSTRISRIGSPTVEQLMTIEAEDILSAVNHKGSAKIGGFDEAAIDDALARLDSLVGLGKVKSAIHNFVNVARYLNSCGERIKGKGLLKWNFTGNTGTGKSTVAQILADILKAMNLIRSSDVTEVKGEEIFNVSDFECNEVLRDAVKRTRKGMLLIDGDAPEFRSNEYRMSSEQIRFKLASLVQEDKSTGALVISECSSPKLSIAHSLASNGIYDYDHTFIFDDYSEEELFEILAQCLKKHEVRFSVEAEVIIKEYIGRLCENRDLAFANARTMKNLSRAIFEAVVLRMSSNTVQNCPTAPDKACKEERIVLDSDVKSFVWKDMRVRIGF